MSYDAWRKSWPDARLYRCGDVDIIGNGGRIETVTAVRLCKLEQTKTSDKSIAPSLLSPNAARPKACYRKKVCGFASRVKVIRNLLPQAHIYLHPWRGSNIVSTGFGA